MKTQSKLLVVTWDGEPKSKISKYLTDLERMRMGENANPNIQYFDAYNMPECLPQADALYIDCIPRNVSGKEYYDGFAPQRIERTQDSYHPITTRSMTRNEL